MNKRSIVILDLGSQYTHLIARCIRSLGVYSVVFPHTTSLKNIFLKRSVSPYGIILSGGPASVYERAAPKVDERLFNNNNNRIQKVPILGICYGMQLMTHVLGGKVKKSQVKEYGHKEVQVIQKRSASQLYKRVTQETIHVWMSHGDIIESCPSGFEVTAKTAHAIASIESKSRHMYGVQYHPEVVHTEKGEVILSNFVFGVCRAEKNWKMSSFIEDTIDHVKKKVGKKTVLLALSGGVDSMVMAALLHRAIGKKLLCIFVDNGLMRLGEVEQIVRTFEKVFQFPLKTIEAADYFLKKLKGVRDPETKRKIIGKAFVDIFYKHLKKDTLLAQGTLYPDVIESVSTKGPSDKIKTHHNRATEVLRLMKEGRVIEPFCELFKDEVREIGKKLGVPNHVLERHPYPGPGLGVRILGAVTLKRLERLRRADAIFIQELHRLRLYSKIWQAFAVLLPARAVGVMGDQRTYGYVIVLRAVTSVDGMTADIYSFSKSFLRRVATRIVGEVEGITRVTYDISTKPPATIEWE